MSTPRTARRVAAVVAAGSLCLAAACGGGGDEPKAGPTQTDTGIPLPTATAAETFAGQGLSQVQLDKISKAMSTALQKGDEKAFLSYIAPGKPRLVEQQRLWFRNVRKMPMRQREIVVVRPDDDIDSSGKGTLTALVGLKHRITGADAKPITEWYSFGFKREADQDLRIVSVGGAPADVSSGVKYSRYYRQSWDDPNPVTAVQDDKVVLIGPEADAAAMRRILPTLSAATRAAVDRFVRAGVALESDVRTRKWVFQLASPAIEDFNDYLGGLIDRREAQFAGYAKPVFASIDANNASLDYEEGIAVTRIVLNRLVLGYSSSQLGAIIRHEMTHGVQQQWEGDLPGSVPTWATEGFAVYMSDAPASERDYRASSGRRGLAGARAMPSDEAFYSGNDDEVAEHYGMGYLAISYLVDRVGLKKLISAIEKAEGDYRGDFFSDVGVSRKGFVDAVRKAAGA